MILKNNFSIPIQSIVLKNKSILIFMRYNNPTKNIIDSNLKKNVNMKLEDVKVSKENSCNALFDECLEELYKMKRKIDKESVEYDNSPVIEELNKEEIKITKNIFERINKKKKHVSHLSYKDIYIDPYWNPFKEVNDLKDEITYEFNEYSKLASIVELKKQKRAIKKSLKEQYRLYNPYSDEYNNYFNLNIDKDEVICNDKSEKYWNPSFDKRKILNIKSPFTWRHTHILHNFIGENGLILPRKFNLTTRKQQIQIFKSICIARRMAIYPYDKKPDKDDLIPLMDPMQLLADELIHRYIELKDLRAQAIIKVMINKYPSLNYYKYFCYESKKKKEKQEKGKFSQILRKYKKNYYENSFNY
ncbi:mitochondrial ribosomal protein S18 precursor, putative [Plasmodium relictum]|uniref:Mitochondrial ribosomal protein S18, putative n=1 Tax=Plasmodium relictum TaxID=85471 RepID=A0A1J1HCW3_PLARL|nr:mitochondrial ribosomal protein S18 precursor, putative [Plasmodium relictum]CRH03763.1 mitochondrial ribosomal protein S18 precursor, putative [Plasmodium relictum]